MLKATAGSVPTTGGNTIAFSGFDDVNINDSVVDSIADNTNGNCVLKNSIFSNGELGIDLDTDGPDFNDAGDADSGANGRQNRPVITSAKTVSGLTTIKSTLNSTANKTFRVQFFSNPSGKEGKKFIGQKKLIADASGNVSFTFTPTMSGF